MPLRQYQELIGWKKSMALVAEIYRHTQNFPKDEIYGLTSQLRRAPFRSQATSQKDRDDSRAENSSSSSDTHAVQPSKSKRNC